MEKIVQVSHACACDCAFDHAREADWMDMP